ncbi:MAG: hypothetical protein KatS3mg097_428 [Candidatus Parcubacteria bacterium]|nr:MAG: hypothetical protein KatS3mg097_428 [Candidatus Parcubacteria bacterium]
MNLQNKLYLVKAGLVLAILVFLIFLFNYFVKAQESSGSPSFNVSGWAWTNMASGSSPIYDHDPTIGWVVFSCNTKIKKNNDTEEPIKICSDGLDKGKICNIGVATGIPRVDCRNYDGSINNGFCQDACRVSRFGVDINTSTGCITGDAWSSNIGWISFNKNSSTFINGISRFPNGYNPASSTCPNSLAVLESTSTLFVTTTKILGWARAVAPAIFQDREGRFYDPHPNSGGWDGWISFNKFTGTVDYGVYIDKNGDFHGWAWSDDKIGWLSFNSEDTRSTIPYKVSLSSSTISRNLALTLTPNPNPVTVGQTTTFSYSTSGTVNCNITEFWSGVPCGLSITTSSCNYVPTATGNYAYYIAATATCAGITFFATSGTTLVVTDAPIATLNINSYPSGVSFNSSFGSFTTPRTVTSTATITATLIASSSVNKNGTNYDFVEWVNCNSVSGSNGETCNVSVNPGETISITANYRARGVATLNIISSPISVSINDALINGSSANFTTPHTVTSTATITATLTAPLSVISGTNYDFVKWVDCDSVSGSNGETCNVTVAPGAITTVSANYNTSSPPSPPTTGSTTLKIVTPACNGEIATTSHLSRYAARSDPQGGEYLSAFNTTSLITEYNAFLSSRDANRTQCPYIVINDKSSSFKLFIDVENVNTSTTYTIKIKNNTSGKEGSLLDETRFSQSNELKYISITDISADGIMSEFAGLNTVSLEEFRSRNVVATSSLNIYGLRVGGDSCYLRNQPEKISSSIYRSLCNFWINETGMIRQQ